MIKKKSKKRKRKSLKQRIVAENDRIWSLNVRNRDNYTCQICGKKTNHAEAMHVFGCGWKNTRWVIANGVTGCFYCHRFKMHGGKLSEDEKKKIWIGILGSKEKYDFLYRESRKLVKFNLAFVEKWNKILKEQFVEIMGMTYREYLKRKKGG